MLEISKITKEGTEQLIAEQPLELVRDNVALYGQSFVDYSNAVQHLGKHCKENRKNGNHACNAKENAPPFV